MQFEFGVAPLFGRASFACRFGSDQAHGGGAFRAGDRELHRVIGVDVSASGGVATANDARVERMLKQLDPDARFEQVCDLEAMKHISKDKTYKPERTDRQRARRAEGRKCDDDRHWRGLQEQGPVVSSSRSLRDHADHMQVQAFSFQIGEPIPEERWEKNGLW